jgi:general secretion pathway protein C
MRTISFSDHKLTLATQRLELWSARGLRILRAQPATRWITLTEVTAVVGLAALSAQLVWTIAGSPQWPAAIANAAAPAFQANSRDWQASALTTLDPFHRNATPGAAAVGEGAPETMLNLQLFGIRAGSGSHGGSAIIAGADKFQSAYFVGQEIMPGVRLERVEPGRVTIRRNGVIESLSLDREKTPDPVKTETVASVFVEQNAERSWRHISVSAAALFANLKFANQDGGGVILQPGAAADLLAQAGLKAGDVLVGVNGTPVTDITSLMAIAAAWGDAERLSLETVSEGQRKIHKLAVDQ